MLKTGAFPKKSSRSRESNPKKVCTMKVCKECIIPDSFPSVTFSNGICSFCRDSKQLTNNQNTKGSGRLREILRSKKTDSYDCIVPMSGGKDSSYILYYAVRELGLKPLALFFYSGFANDLCKKNVEDICKKLAVDLIVVKSTNFRRKAVREALYISKYTKRFWEGICGNCENNLRTAAINEATKRKIPSILWGSTLYEEFIPGKYEKRRRFQEARTFGERKTIKLLINYILTYRILLRCRKITEYIRTLTHKLKYDFYVIRDNIDTKAPEGWRKFVPFLEVSFKNKKVQTIYFFDYVPYDPHNQIETLKTELEWKAPFDKETRWDCKLHCFPQYDFLRRTGITMDGFILANLVRNRLLTRADALEKEETMNKELIRECQETLEELGFNYNIIDKKGCKNY